MTCKVGRDVRWVSSATPVNTNDNTTGPIGGITTFNDGVFYYAHTLSTSPTSSNDTFSDTHAIFNKTAVLQNTRTCLIFMTNHKPIYPSVLKYLLAHAQLSDAVGHICFRFNFISHTSVTHKKFSSNCKPRMNLS